MSRKTTRPTKASKITMKTIPNPSEAADSLAPLVFVEFLYQAGVAKTIAEWVVEGLARRGHTDLSSVWLLISTRHLTEAEIDLIRAETGRPHYAGYVIPAGARTAPIWAAAEIAHGMTTTIDRLLTAHPPRASAETSVR